jgi:hypothetical protein
LRQCLLGWLAKIAAEGRRKVPFCNSCGRIIEVNDKFCSYCGTTQSLEPQVQYTPAPPAPIQPPPVNTMQPTPTYPPPPPTVSQPPTQNTNSTEQVLGVILLRKPKSLGRYDSFTGVVTNYRFIVAVMTSQMLNDAAMQARDQAKAEGRGFFGQWEDQLKATVNYTKRYLTMDPNTVLAESPGNFALDNQGIREVKIHLKNQQNMHRQHTHEFSIELVSAQGNYEFHMG